MIKIAITGNIGTGKSTVAKILKEFGLKVFESDEIVNKIRSEVDTEAEIINGSIIEPSLEGKIRVSIVATALDGQQPESKSVINMVHRIQNRNPGYTDFSNSGSTQSFQFTNNSNSIITNGANALKIDEELKSESQEASNMNEVEETNYSSNVIQEIESKNESSSLETDTIEENKEDLTLLFQEIYPKINDPQAPCDQDALKKADTIFRRVGC